MINLGRHSYMGKVIELFNPVVDVGNFCSIADDVIFMGKDSHHPPVYNHRCVSSFPFKEKWQEDYSPSGIGTHGRGPTVIGHDVWIGHGVLIMDGAVIGDGCIIGAGAVIGYKYFPPYTVVVGNPGTIKHFRFDHETINELLEIHWWDWDDERIRKAIPYMKDVELFIQYALGG